MLLKNTVKDVVHVLQLLIEIEGALDVRAGKDSCDVLIRE
jgi:hypothetical protein